MTTDAHNKVDSLQKDLDKADLSEDQRLSLDPQKVDSMTELYITRVDDLQDKVLTLSQSAGEAGVQLEYSVMNALAGFLERVDPNGYASLAEEFGVFLDKQIGLVEGLERQVAVPQEFINLASVLGYGPEVMADYYYVYAEQPEGSRFSVNDVGILLKGLDQSIARLEALSQVDPYPQRAQILAEAFGYLVYGDRQSFNEYMDRLNLENQFIDAQNATAENAKLQEEVAGLTEKAEKFDQIVSTLKDEIVDLQEKNPHWAEFWKPDSDRMIESKLNSLRQVEFQREGYYQEVSSRQDKIVKNNAVVYGFQYSYGVASGAPQDAMDRMLLDMSKTLGDEMPADLNDELSQAYTRVLSSADLTPFELAYYSGGDAMAIAVENYNEVSDSENSQAQEQDLVKALEGDSNVLALKKVSGQISEKFAPIAQFFQAAVSGHATVDMVVDLKARASELLGVYDEASIMQLLSDAKGSMEALKGLDFGVEESEFEKMFGQVQGALNGFETLVEEESVVKLCNGILDKSFTADNCAKWIKTDGLVLATAVACGVLAVTVVGAPLAAGLGVASGFSAGFAAGAGLLVLNSSLMAAGSLVGTEIGKEASDLMFDTGLESEIRRVSEGDIGWDEFALSYTKQFGFNFVLSLAFMAGGKAFCSVGNMDVAGLSAFSRAVQKVAGGLRIPSLGEAGVVGDFCGEVAREIGEEVAENVAQGINPVLGGLASFWNSLDGVNVSANMDGSYGVAVVSQKRSSNKVENIFEYRKGNDEQVIASLKKSYGDGAVSVDADGVITCKTVINLPRRGRVFENTMVFKPTTESPAMRRTLSKGGISIKGVMDFSVSARYRIKYDAATRQYTYGRLTATGAEGFTKYLQGDGYVISKIGENGEFEARKGEEVVKFRCEGELPSGYVRVRGRPATDSVLENSRLDNGARLIKAQALLERNDLVDAAGIPTTKGQAVLNAHEIGKDGTGAYTRTDISQKARILNGAGFTSVEIRTLMEYGITGLEFRICVSGIAPVRGPSDAQTGRYSVRVGSEVNIQFKDGTNGRGVITGSRQGYDGQTGKPTVYYFIEYSQAGKKEVVEMSVGKLNALNREVSTDIVWGRFDSFLDEKGRKWVIVAELPAGEYGRRWKIQNETGKHQEVAEAYLNNFKLSREAYTSTMPGNQLSDVRETAVGLSEGLSILRRAEIHGEISPIEDRSLTTGDLERAGLQPKHKISINNVDLYISAPYFLEQGRIARVMYVKTPNGNVVARSIYMSNSSMNWRVLANHVLMMREGRIEIEWYGKGHGEESVSLSSKVQTTLANLLETTGEPVLDLSRQGLNPLFVFAGTTRQAEYRVFKDARGKMVREPMPSRTLVREVYEKPISLRGNFRSGSSPETLRFENPGDEPNFRSIASSYKTHNDTYGEVTVEVFMSKNGQYKYSFARDARNRVWIMGGEVVQSEICSVGVAEQWIDLEAMGTPAYEYVPQIASQYANHGDSVGQYVDTFTLYLSRIPVIRRYYQERGISMPR